MRPSTDYRASRPGPSTAPRSRSAPATPSASHGVVHGFTNGGGVDARFLATATPGVFGSAYFREIGDVLAADGPPDLVAIADVMHRHGLTPAPPAGA